MRLRQLIVILEMVFLLSSFVPVKQNFDKKSEKEEIAKVIDSVIGWAKNKDIKRFYASILNDSTFLSVRPNGVARGIDEIRKSEAFWLHPDFVYVDHEIQDLTITISDHGNVAWFFCILNDRNTWKGQPAEWLNTRWTGVLQKRDNNWVIVQQHFSFDAKE